MPSSRRERGGFTLLEVLAAVAILGIWYVILAAVGIQGLRSQGETYRRLEASFLADEVISNIEAGLTQGSAPPEGVEEYEREDFTVRIEVEPYTLEVPALEGVPTRSSSSIGIELPALPSTDLLGGGDLSGPGPLRRIRIEISWPEGNHERSIVRNTFAFDLDSVQSELEALGEALGQVAVEEAEDDEAAEDEQGQSGGSGGGGQTPGVEEFGEALRSGATQ